MTALTIIRSAGRDVQPVNLFTALALIAIGVFVVALGILVWTSKL